MKLFSILAAFVQKLVLMLVVSALALSSASVAKSQKKLFVYYPTWGAYTMPPKDLKFPSGMQTIYMHFSAHASTTPPYFSVVVPGNTDSSDLAYRQQELVDTCHHAGQKVLLSITAQDNTMGNIAGNATQRRAFVSSVCAYLKRKGYDGVNLDWEINLSASGVAAMARELRDTLNVWTIPGMLTMSVLTDPFTYSSWNYYDITAMDQYLDAYFTMSYGMHSVERQADALTSAGGIWRCMYDAPYMRPVGAPWSSYAGGYWAANFKENGIDKWMARGADTAKIGVGFWNGGTRLLGSSSSSVPGSAISNGAADFATYATVLGSASNYDAEPDHYWGIIGGRFTSWIDSAGAYRRTKWAVDTMRTKVVMLYDAFSGFLPTAQRYGRQPHFDAIVNAMNSVTNVAERLPELPSGYVLRQNYPNPFNNSTVIEYEIPKESDVRIAIYDGLGKLVDTLVNQHQTSGVYRLQFDAKSLSSGVYYYRMNAGAYQETKQLQLIK